MPDKSTYGSMCTVVVSALAATVLIAVAAGYVVLWVEGLPGRDHAAYLARGAYAIYTKELKYYDDAYGHLPAATAECSMGGKQSSCAPRPTRRLCARGLLRHRREALITRLTTTAAKRGTIL